MRLIGSVPALAMVIVACGGPAAAEPSPWPTQTYGEIRVALVRPSSTHFVALPPPVGTAVTVAGSSFDPPVLQVPLGQTVTWTNRDAIAHTTTSGVPGVPDGKWDGQLYSGATFSFSFTRTGTYAYFCRFHSSMHATIVVR